MTKVVAAKGMAVKALQPAAHDVPVAKTMANTAHDLIFVKTRAPRGPPAKAGGARPAAKVLPKPKQRAADLHNAIADLSNLPPKDVKSCLEALCDVAAKSLRDDGVFKLPNMVLIRLKKTSPRPARTRLMFGKEVVLAAKPAGQKITTTAVKPFYDAVSAGG